MFFILNDKNSGVKKLEKYFCKFNIEELDYYIQKNSNQTIPDFFDDNVFEPEEFELTNFLEEHFNVVIEKFLANLPTELTNIPKIKISFITEYIYWTELFAIENNIFISYPYLIRVFDRLETNSYKNINDVFINKNKIYDMELCKKIAESFFSIIQFYNQDLWIQNTMQLFNCTFIPKYQINFLHDYKILHEPNLSNLDDYITIYSVSPTEIYCSFNSICSDKSFCPYWENIVIKLNYEKGVYKEITRLDTLKLELEPNPTYLIINKIIEQIIIN